MDNAVLSFSGIVSLVHEMYGIHLLKNGVLLIHRHKGHVWIMVKVADPKNWLFLLWNVV